MISIDVNIDNDFLSASVQSVEGIEIRVGILNKSKMAAVPDRSKEPTKAVGGSGRSGSYVDRGAAPTISLGKLAEYLDTRYGVFTDAADRFDNYALNIVTQELIKVFSGNPIQKRQIENAAIMLIRNPIKRMEFGSNAASTIGGGVGYNGYDVSGKGFDWPMVDTGTFFTNIKAEVKSV